MSRERGLLILILSQGQGKDNCICLVLLYCSGNAVKELRSVTLIALQLTADCKENKTETLHPLLTKSGIKKFSRVKLGYNSY